MMREQFCFASSLSSPSAARRRGCAEKIFLAWDRAAFSARQPTLSLESAHQRQKHVAEILRLRRWKNFDSGLGHCRHFLYGTEGYCFFTLMLDLPRLSTSLPLTPLSARVYSPLLNLADGTLSISASPNFVRTALSPLRLITSFPSAACNVI